MSGTLERLVYMVRKQVKMSTKVADECNEMGEYQDTHQANALSCHRTECAVSQNSCTLGCHHHTHNPSLVQRSVGINDCTSQHDCHTSNVANLP